MTDERNDNKKDITESTDEPVDFFLSDSGDNGEQTENEQPEFLLTGEGDNNNQEDNDDLLFVGQSDTTVPGEDDKQRDIVLLENAMDMLDNISNYYSYFNFENFADLSEEDFTKISEEIDSLTNLAKKEWERVDPDKLKKFNEIVNKVKAAFRNKKIKKNRIDEPLEKKLYDEIESRLHAYLDDNEFELDEYYKLTQHAANVRIITAGDKNKIENYFTFIEKAVEKSGGVILDLEKEFERWIKSKPGYFCINVDKRITEITGYYLELKTKDHYIRFLEELPDTIKSEAVTHTKNLLEKLHIQLQDKQIQFKNHAFKEFTSRGIIKEDGKIEEYYIDTLKRTAIHDYLFTEEEFHSFLAQEGITIRPIRICFFIIKKDPLERKQISTYQDLILHMYRYWNLALENITSQVEAIRVLDEEMAKALDEVLHEPGTKIKDRHIPEKLYPDYTIQKCIEQMVKMRLDNDNSFLPHYSVKEKIDFGDLFIGQESVFESIECINSLKFEDKDCKNNGFIYQLSIHVNTDTLPFSSLVHDNDSAAEFQLYGNENILTLKIDVGNAFETPTLVNRNYHSSVEISANDGLIKETILVRYNLLVPTLRIYPNDIDFEEVYIGEDTKIKTLTLSQSGKGECYNISSRLNGDLPFLSLRNDSIQKLGQQQRIKLELDCREAIQMLSKMKFKKKNKFSGSIQIQANNGLNDEIIPVSYTLLIPEIEISSKEIDFGKIYIGDDIYKKTFVLKNITKGTHSNVTIDFDNNELPYLSINKQTIDRFSDKEEIILTLDVSSAYLHDNGLLVNGENPFSGELSISTNNGLYKESIKVNYTIQYLSIEEKGSFAFDKILLGTKARKDFILYKPGTGNLKIKEFFPSMAKVSFTVHEKNDHFCISAHVDGLHAQVNDSEEAEVTLRTTAGMKTIKVSYKIFYNTIFSVVHTICGALIGFFAGIISIFWFQNQPANALSCISTILLVGFGIYKYRNKQQEKTARIKPAPFSSMYNSVTNVSLMAFPLLLIIILTSYTPMITKGVSTLLGSMDFNLPFIYTVSVVILILFVIFILRLFLHNRFIFRKIDPATGKLYFDKLKEEEKRTRGKKR